MDLHLDELHRQKREQGTQGTERPEKESRLYELVKHTTVVSMVVQYQVVQVSKAPL